MTLAAAYSGLKSAKSRAATEASDARIHDSHGVLATTYLTLCRGLTYLSPLMLSPSWWKFRARWKFAKDNRAHRNDLFEKDTHYQEFMAQHGPEARAKRAADV